MRHFMSLAPAVFIVVLIKRGNISFVPVGQTRLHENDTVVVIDE